MTGICYLPQIKPTEVLIKHGCGNASKNVVFMRLIYKKVEQNLQNLTNAIRANNTRSFPMLDVLGNICADTKEKVQTTTTSYCLDRYSSTGPSRLIESKYFPFDREPVSQRLNLNE